MSDATQAALEAALAAHIADVTDGGIVTDWCAVVAVKHLDDLDSGVTQYRLEANVNQALHVTAGLLAYAAAMSLEDQDDE